MLEILIAHAELALFSGGLATTDMTISVGPLFGVTVTTKCCTYTVSLQYLCINNAIQYGMPRGKPKLKTVSMTLRVEPRVKIAAELAAKRDRRSLTNFIEVLVLEYCESIGIDPDSFHSEEIDNAEDA